MVTGLTTHHIGLGVNMPFSTKECHFILRRYLCAQCFSPLGYEIIDTEANEWECRIVCLGEVHGESCGDVEEVGRVTKYFAIQEGQKRADQFDLLDERIRALDGDEDVLAPLRDRYEAMEDYKQMTVEEKVATLGF